MKKKMFLSLLLAGASWSGYAQKGDFKVGLYGGYELPERDKLHISSADGFDVAVDMKYYVHDRIYALATVFTSKTKGQQGAWIEVAEDYHLNGREQRTVVNTMVGLGMGVDFLRIGRHSAFAQGAFGLVSWVDDWEKIHSHTNYENGYVVYNSSYDNYADWGIVGKIGYNFQINRWLGVGVAYNISYLRLAASSGFQGGVQFCF